MAAPLHLLDLPMDTLCHITSFLRQKDRLALALVCKHLCAVSRSPASGVFTLHININLPTVECMHEIFEHTNKYSDNQLCKSLGCLLPPRSIIVRLESLITDVKLTIRGKDSNSAEVARHLQGSAIGVCQWMIFKLQSFLTRFTRLADVHASVCYTQDWLGYDERETASCVFFRSFLQSLPILISSNFSSVTCDVSSGHDPSKIIRKLLQTKSDLRTLTFHERCAFTGILNDITSEYVPENFTVAATGLTELNAFNSHTTFPSEVLAQLTSVRRLHTRILHRRNCLQFVHSTNHLRVLVLFINDTHVHQDRVSLAPLSGCPSLEFLSLSGRRTSACSLENDWPTEFLERMKGLSLEKLQVRGGEWLLLCKNLVKLSLRSVDFSECDRVPALNCEQLRHVDINWDGRRDEQHLAPNFLEKCRVLEVVRICGVVVEGVGGLASPGVDGAPWATRLREVNLLSCDITDTSCFSHCTTLTCIHLSGVTFTSDPTTALRPLKTCPNIRYFLIWQDSGSTFPLPSPPAWPHLKSLEINGDRVQLRTLKPLEECGELEHLSLNIEVGKDQMPDLAPLAYHPTLKEFTLYLDGEGAKFYNEQSEERGEYQFAPLALCPKLESVYTSLHEGAYLKRWLRMERAMYANSDAPTVPNVVRLTYIGGWSTKYPSNRNTIDRKFKWKDDEISDSLWRLVEEKTPQMQPGKHDRVTVSWMGFDCIVHTVRGEECVVWLGEGLKWEECTGGTGIVELCGPPFGEVCRVARFKAEHVVDVPAVTYNSRYGFWLSHVHDLARGADRALISRLLTCPKDCMVKRKRYHTCRNFNQASSHLLQRAKELAGLTQYFE